MTLSLLVDEKMLKSSWHIYISLEVKELAHAHSIIIQKNGKYKKKKILREFLLLNIASFDHDL